MIGKEIGHDQEKGGKNNGKQSISLKGKSQQHTDQGALGSPKQLFIPFTGALLFYKTIMEQGSQGYIHPTQEGNMGMGMDHLPVVEPKGKDRVGA
nr:hypothetical protein [uncultured Allomuricauda sp.]